MTIILGLNAYHGDSSACLLRDGILLAAAEEERFRRIKHWAGFPAGAIRYCLSESMTDSLAHWAIGALNLTYSKARINMETRAAAEVELQRNYYAATAQKYDAMHVSEGDEHYFALCVMLGAVDFLGVTSILEIGSGTGRSLVHLKKVRPDLLVRGIEPVKALREIAYSKGVSPSDLTDGDALALEFEDGQFDMVCAFGVLHHIRAPERAVAELLRVSRRAIFISDSNNFGQGSLLTRSLKQIVDMLRLWPVADFLKTRGRGYSVTEGDGLAYSYSVFNNYAQIRQHCKSVHLMNTGLAGFNLYRTAGHVALVGVKH